MVPEFFLRMPPRLKNVKDFKMDAEGKLTLRRIRMRIQAKSRITSSVVEPEPDFFAETGAVEKDPALGCCCVA